MKTTVHTGGAKDPPMTSPPVRQEPKSSSPLRVSTVICASSRGDPPVHSLCHTQFHSPNPAELSPPARSYRERKVRIVAFISVAVAFACLAFGQIGLGTSPSDQASAPTFCAPCLLLRQLWSLEFLPCPFFAGFATFCKDPGFGVPVHLTHLTGLTDLTVPVISQLAAPDPARQLCRQLHPSLLPSLNRSLCRQLCRSLCLPSPILTAAIRSIPQYSGVFRSQKIFLALTTDQNAP